MRRKRCRARGPRVSDERLLVTDRRGQGHSHHGFRARSLIIRGMEFQSRAVRTLVEIHEHELRRFLDVWDSFAASDVPMPEARGDESYASRETLVTHVVGAARNYLTWIGECVGRPVTDVDGERDPAKIAPRARAFAEEILAAWRRHLAALADAGGEFFSVETMLEHALVHPMRHRLQLERALAGAVDAVTRGPVQPGSTLRLLRFHSHHRELIIYSFPSRTSPIGADRAAAAATRGAAGSSAW